MKTHTLFEATDYRPLNDGETYKDKFVILRPSFFKEEYKEAKNQLFLAQSGFGCDPSNFGGKVFGKFYDEDTQIRREDILGVAIEEAIAKWEQTYGLSREVFYH